MKRVLGLLLILLLLTGLFACKKKGNDPATEPEVFFEITFSTTLLPYDSTPPESVMVKKGDALLEPTLQTTPTAGNRVIWTQSSAQRTPYDFSAPVEGSFVLYAVEVPRNYTITYLLEIGTNSRKNPTTYSAASETITLVDPILPLGYLFDKWSYFDDPDSVVTEIEQGTEGDVILRAKIVPIEYEVYYKEAGEGFTGARTYRFGDTMSLESPLRENLAFRGWTIYMDPQRTPVTTLTPEFVKQHKSALFHGNGSGIGLLANWEEEE